MGDRDVDRAVKGHEYDISNPRVTGIRLLCLVLFLSTGIVLALAGLWLTFQGISLNHGYDRSYVVQPLAAYPGVAILIFGLISLICAIDFRKDNRYFYDIYFKFKARTEKEWTLFGYCAGRIITIADKMENKAISGLLLSASSYALTALLAGVLTAIALALLLYSGYLAVALFFALAMLTGYLRNRRNSRPNMYRMQSEIRFVPLPSDDPITGIWNSQENQIIMAFPGNGTFQTIVAPRDGGNNSFFSGSVRKDTVDHYWIYPQMKGRSKDTALPCEDSPTEFVIENGSLCGVHGGIVFSRSAGSAQYGVEKGGYASSGHFL